MPPVPWVSRLLCTGCSLVRGLSASIGLAGSQARAAEALLAEAPGAVPSTTAGTGRSRGAVSEDSHVWICSATRFVPEAGTVGEKGIIGG